MNKELQIAIELKKELDHFRPLEPETELRILQKFKLDWNYHSNNIEGNSLTYGETKALILHGITAQGKPLKDHFEITGHNEAIEWILEIVKGERPLTESFIRQFHQILLKEPYEVDAITPEGMPTKKLINVGEYKSTPNHVKTVTGEIFYFASVEETPAMMSDLVQWYREKKSELNPIILAAEFHYRFIRIHPFDDGNGRVARLLMNFILMDNGYPPVVIKTEDKESYFAVLRQADSGTITPFILFITENLCSSLRLMISGAKGEDIYDSHDALKEFKLLQSEISSRARFDKNVKLKQRQFASQMVKEIIYPTIEFISNTFLNQVGVILDNASVNRKIFNSKGKGKVEPGFLINNQLDQGSALAAIRETKCDSLSLHLRWDKIKELPNIRVVIVLDINIHLSESGVSLSLISAEPDSSQVILENSRAKVSSEFLQRLNSVLLSSINKQVRSYL